MLPVIFLSVVLLQTALIYYHHFSPFERETNLRAVLWGARPGPRYWAVVLLDVCAGLLLAQLVLSTLPLLSPVDDPTPQALRFVPAWIAVSILAGVFHHFLNGAILRFPNWQLMARQAAGAALMGIAVFAASLLMLCVALAPDYSSALALWLSLAPLLALVGLPLALIVFLARALAFYLRVVPVVGAFLHAAVSTFLLVWLLELYGRWLWSLAVEGGLAQPRGLAGLENVVAALTALALGALVLAWRLPGAERHSDAVDPPLLVVDPPAPDALRRATVTETGAVCESARLRVEVTRAPFGVTVRNAEGQTLWQLAERGVTGDALLFKILSIPLLYTGNTIKSKWRAGGRSFGCVTGIERQGEALVVSFAHGTVRLAFHADDILHISAQRKPGLSLANALSVSFLAPDDAHYLGLGQRFDRIDQRGQDVDFLVEEGGVGYEWASRRFPLLAPILKRLYGERGSFPNGPHCTGFPIPFALVSRERGPTTGLFWDTYRPSWLKMAPPVSSNSLGENKGELAQTRLTVLGDHLDLYLCAGPTALDAIRQYTDLTDRSDAPPPWAFLPWKTRTGAVTEADTLEDIRRFRQLDIPLAQVGIEHWQDVRGSYEFSQQWWPHIDELIATARANGYRVHIWHFPYMNAGAATHREGVRQGYFLRNRLGLPYQQRIFHGLATVVDYTNPRAAAWHQQIVQRAFHERGIAGVMTDYAESVPPDCVCYNGASGLALRNAYPVLYVQSMQRAARAVLGDDYIIYPRAGYAGSQRFVNAQWPGDQDTDWDDGDGLPAAVRAMLNVSLCGFPVHGSDIGGWYDWFTPITTQELFLRWAEVGAYSPLMRAHGGPVGRNREPWKFDDETVEIYRALSAEHVKLFPYLYTLAHQAARTGAPIIRHPALLWPDGPELYAIQDAWMIGEALYVAPVVRPGRMEREVFLPPGDWWSLSEDRAVHGPARLVVPTPFGQVPRFLRRGCILPRFARAFDTFDEVPTARVGHLDDDIEAWLYPSDRPATFTLFDGTQLREGETTAKSRRVAWKIWG